MRLLLLMLFCAVAAPLQAAAPCDDHCLLGIAGSYLDALSNNDPAGAPLAGSLHATENGAASLPAVRRPDRCSTARRGSYRQCQAGNDRRRALPPARVRQPHKRA